MERYREIRRHRRLKRFKFIIILSLFILMGFGLSIVNDTMRQLNILEDTEIFHFDYKSSILDILGKTYIIDIKVLKDFFKARITGLLFYIDCFFCYN